RHTKMVDMPAGRDDRFRDDVAAVDDDRGAVHKDQIGPRFGRGGDMRREIGDRVFAALFGDEPAAEGREALFGYGAGLVEDAFLEPGEAGLDERDLARHEGGAPRQTDGRGR